MKQDDRFEEGRRTSMNFKKETFFLFFLVPRGYSLVPISSAMNIAFLTESKVGSLQDQLAGQQIVLDLRLVIVQKLADLRYRERVLSDLILGVLHKRREGPSGIDRLRLWIKCFIALVCCRLSNCCSMLKSRSQARHQKVSETVVRDTKIERCQ